MRVHTCLRGNQYHYVCRVPSDLQHLFPTFQIAQSLKTDKEKDAMIAATALEYRSQKPFLQLRTGMLPKELEKRLVASYLLRGASRIEAQATGETYSPPAPDGPLDKVFNDEAGSRHKTTGQVLESLAANGESAPTIYIQRGRRSILTH